jgi:hypothetical protein
MFNKIQSINSSSLFVIPILLYKIYKNWKDNELYKIKYKCLSFIKNGYILIDSIDPIYKRKSWYEVLLPLLLKHWNKEHGNIGFDINDKTTWPVSKDGRYDESNINHYLLY